MFFWVTAVRVLSLTGCHSPPHLPSMSSNTVLNSGPAVGAAQIVTWSYSCVFLPPMSTAIRASAFSLWELSMPLYIFHRHRVCLVDRVDLTCSLYSWWGGFGSSSLATWPLGFISISACGSFTGICPETALENLGLNLWGPGMECGCLGLRGSGSTRYSGELVARAECSRRVWYPVLANMLQYSCWRTPLPDREAWQVTVYRVTMSQTRLKWPFTHRCKNFVSCGSSAPVRVEHESGAAAWLAGTLAAPSVQDMNCLHRRSYGPVRVFSRAFCSWQSEGLFGRSFSLTLPVQGS